MSKTRKTLLTILVIGIVGALAGIGTFSAFSSTTSNTGNDFAAGTVYIADNDAGSAMYNVTNQAPGDVVQRCILVTYTGTLNADVELYSTSGALNALADYVDVTVEQGTMSPAAFPNCAGDFAGASIYSGTLSNFMSSYTGWGSGLSAGAWAQNDAYAFRFTLTLQDDAAANGGAGGALATGAHSFTWEAQNQ
jgi:predicted ribosomally synthesized peptide with SipW-like signal peptide